VDAHDMPVRVFVTADTAADCALAIALMDGFAAENLLVDRGYDFDAIIGYAASNGMSVVIPSKKNRKVQRGYDKELYRVRYLIENAFLRLKC
jgi:transposase